MKQKKEYNTKKRLFEMMGKLNMSFKNKLNENIRKKLINMFVASLPDNFPFLVQEYAKNKNIGLDSAYYQFIGAFEKKFEKDNGIQFHLSDDEIEELPTFMYGRFSDKAIEF